MIVMLVPVDADGLDPLTIEALQIAAAANGARLVYVKTTASPMALKCLERGILDGVKFHEKPKPKHFGDINPNISRWKQQWKR